MFIPLHDDTPLKLIRFQWMTGTLIAINSLLFLLLISPPAVLPNRPLCIFTASCP